MKARWVITAVGLGLAGWITSASAQYGYGGPGYGGGGYGGRGYDEDYGPSRRRGGYGFDEREYLRCNPDVRRAVARGQMESGIAHYQTFGRREGRRLSC